MDNLLWMCMNCIDSLGQFIEIALCKFGWQWTLSLEKRFERATSNEWHGDIEQLPILSKVEDRHDVRMPQLMSITSLTAERSLAVSGSATAVVALNTFNATC